MNKNVLFRCALLVVTWVMQPVFAQEVKGDAAAGAKKVDQCIGCHGLKGYHASFPEIYRVPMISGQNEKYLASALSAYKRGERKHPTMRGVAVSLDEKDIADVSAYYANAKTPGRGTAATGSAAHPEKAAELVKKGACQSCHGEDFNKPVDPAYPKLAGQYADYLAVALRAYKAEGNAVVGRGNAIMGGVAKQFSNDELRVIANYLASLPGDVETTPQGKFK